MKTLRSFFASGFIAVLFCSLIASPGFAAFPATVAVTPENPASLGTTIISGIKVSTTAAGTVYTLTNTAAAVDFGTTDPVIVLTKPGRYLLIARVTLNYVGATYAAERTVTLKIRRTNNTAADVETSVQQTAIITTTTAVHGTFFIVAAYDTTNTTVGSVGTDSLTIFADVSTVASAGSETVSAASITAIPQ